MQHLIEPGRGRVVHKNTVVGGVVDKAGGMAARHTFWPSEFVFVFVFFMVKKKRDIDGDLLHTC